MASPSTLAVIERYEEYRHALDELIGSIVTGIASPALFDDAGARGQAVRCAGRHYPFIDLLYLLDAAGVQLTPNLPVRKGHPAGGQGLGASRAQRPYFVLAYDRPDGVAITAPYLSNASGLLCITAIVRIAHPNQSGGQDTGYLVLDIDLAEAVAFLMGDASRKRFVPFFKSVYSVIVAGLFAVVLLLGYAALKELAEIFGSAEAAADLHLKPFGVIIFLTLGLAVFDLGKTILEEEVLMHKDVYRHSSTRRTITRFMAAILIAVSIEGLLLMFKSAVGDGEHVMDGVWVMLAAVGLLIGLGLYVYLGARAEQLLLSQKPKTGTMKTD
ncbi:MAG: general glycosylation pathway protein [Betaproteobacteria bacterium]|nr:general glycosylation pathway protein [Betaproteobacteria bacterium]